MDGNRVVPGDAVVPVVAARRARVLLTGSLEAAARARLAGAAEVVDAPDLSADGLRVAIRDVDVLLVRAPLPADLFDHAPRLRGVVRQGVGVDMIPVAAATARGLPVANVPGSNRHAVAEHVFAVLGELLRGAAARDRRLRGAGWAAARAGADGGGELHGRTLGVIGVGSVGMRVAEIAHHGYGMRVLGHQRRLDGLPGWIGPRPLDALLAEADAVVLACPLTPQTRHLLDAARLARMRPHALLVNVARGEVVDEAALVDALQDGRLGGAALDVFARQPLAPDHPLMTLPNVLLTPHAAALTVESMARMGEGAVDAALALLDGRQPAHLVNPEVWAGT